jgi:hypothetical protein
VTDASINDPVLGELRRIDAFTHGRTVTVEGRELLAVIETGEGLTPEALTQARRLISAPGDFAQRARHYASESLCDLKNDTWAGDDAPVLASDLAQRLNLEACEIAADGLATLYFADGGLFGGHSIVVSVDVGGGFVDAKLAG